MIKIKFTPPDDDPWNEWIVRCQTATADIIQRKAAGHAVDIDEGLYKTFKASLYMNPNGPFRGKCAYCEDVIEGDQPGDVEHYRPKKQVRDIENSIVERLENGVTVPHPGYYWLAYDWRNLLASCRSCNSRTVPNGQQQGKGNRFPVSDNHAWAPGEEVNERPLLLNPLWDDPDKHLSIDETGVFSWVSERGRITLEVFRLNDRGLPGRRAKHYEDTLNLFKSAASRQLEEGRDDRKVVTKFRRVARIVAGYEAFAAAGQQAVKDLDATSSGVTEFFLNQYPPVA